MAGFPRNHGPWDQAITLHEAAVLAAERTADEPARAVALNGLGIMYRLTGGPANLALGVLLEAQLIFSGDLPAHVSLRDAELGQANALNEQGIVHNQKEDYEAAVEVLIPASYLYREVLDHIGMANTAKNLGVDQYNISLRTGHDGLRVAALKLLNEAMGHYDDAHDALGQVEVLNRRGVLYLKSDEPGQALDDFTEALKHAESVGGPLEKARAHEGIGLCNSGNGKFVDARRLLENAKDAYFRIGAHRDRGRVAEKPDELRSYPDP